MPMSNRHPSLWPMCPESSALIENEQPLLVLLLYIYCCIYERSIKLDAVQSL